MRFGNINPDFELYDNVGRDTDQIEEHKRASLFGDTPEQPAAVCHCFINHALTDEHRAQVSGAIDYARSIGDMAQVPIFLLQLTGDCPARPKRTGDEHA